MLCAIIKIRNYDCEKGIDNKLVNNILYANNCRDIFIFAILE
jgi:hypothetical protein